MVDRLRVRGLRVSFPGRGSAVEAVRGVDLDLEPGAFVALVGESGSGKSLTTLALADVAPEAASVSFESYQVDGREVPREALRTLRGRHLGVVFQDAASALDPLQRIGDALVETLRHAHGLSASAARASAIARLAEVGFPDAEARLDAAPHQLSGGQKQRVALALALATDPPVLLMDEATTALDPILRLALVEALDGLRRSRGLSILFVTHDLGLAAHACDRVVVLYAGRVCEAGPTAAMLGAPRHPYTRGLAGSLPTLGASPVRLPTIPGQVPPIETWDDGCMFRGRCARTSAACAAPPPVHVDGAQRVVCHHPHEAA